MLPRRHQQPQVSLADGLPRKVEVTLEAGEDTFQQDAAEC